METVVDIPANFLCPISLQLMRDPVTVSTGITYDRESIQRWLSSSSNNKACPVTNRPLSFHADLIPNHTLARIIQTWCTLNGVDPIPPPTSHLDTTQIIKLINKAKKHPHTNLECLNRLRSMAVINKSELEAAGVVEYVACLLRDNINQSIMELGVEILFHLRRSSRLKDLMKKEGESIVDSLVQVLKLGDHKSRAHAILTLRSIYQFSDPNQLMCTKVELFSHIMNVVRDRISMHQATKAALKLLVELSPWGRNRIKAVEASAVFVLIEALIECQEMRQCELMLMSLDQLCGCAEGRAEMLRHAAGIAMVSKKVFRVSHVATDRAVRILGSLCRLSCAASCGGVVMEMMQVGAVGKLCLVLEADCKFKTKEKAREILKLHSRVWRNNSTCVPPHLLALYPSQAASSCSS